MRNKALLTTAAILAAVSSLWAQTGAGPDPWQPLRVLAGHWRGTSVGEPGNGTIERTYKFTLANRFIQINNKSIYPPQEKNKGGETHEDVGYFSYDKARKLFVLRQFHIEGFVNTYAQDTSDHKRLVFVSEAIENIAPGWRARESYNFISNDEFTERFELAEPGKEFELYVESHFKRVRE